MSDHEPNLGIGSENYSSLESDQPDSGITSRGRERWSIGKAVRCGLIVFAVSFGLLETGLVYQTISTGSTELINELPKITSASLELAGIFGLITGLSVAKAMSISRS